MKRSPEMMVNSEPDLFSECQVKVNLVSTTAMATRSESRRSAPCTQSHVYTRVGQEGLWPCEGDQTFQTHVSYINGAHVTN